MKSNIIFITIDSLRVDRIYDSNHSAFTPNIDKLIKQGTFFTQTISTSDATGTSIGSIFSGCFPFQTGINHFNFNETVPMFPNVLKENNYFLSSTVPDISFFSKLCNNFDKNFLYVYDKREDWLQLEGGIGDKIIEQLKFLKQHTPWFYFIHLMDLHAPFKLPSQFNSHKFGITPYDQMISSIDVWLGRMFEHINFDETIVILCADHGDYIPLHDIKFHSSINFQKFLRKCKKIFPKLEPVGIKLFAKTKSTIENRRLNKLKNRLSEKEIRTFETRGTTTLFDEVLLIPLIFSGKGVPKSKTIKNLVRQIDIFPTLLDLLKIQFNENEIHGQSLYSLMNDKNLDELPAYIETGTRNPKKEGTLIGIRTSKHKYLKNRETNDYNPILYDLLNDPNEEHNIADQNPLLCKKMEDLLKTLQANSISIKKPKFSNEEEKTIEEELKKLGYL